MNQPLMGKAQYNRCKAKAEKDVFSLNPTNKFPANTPIRRDDGTFENKWLIFLASVSVLKLSGKW